jgi:hypothetical protein
LKKGGKEKGRKELGAAVVVVAYATTTTTTTTTIAYATDLENLAKKGNLYLR